MCTNASEQQTVKMVDSTPASAPAVISSSAALRQRPVGGGEKGEPVMPITQIPQRQQHQQDTTDNDSSSVDSRGALSMVPVDDLDRSFRRATACASFSWAAAIAAVIYLSPPDSFQHQKTDGASLALGAASLVMGASVATRGLALFFKEPDYSVLAECCGSGEGYKHGGFSSSLSPGGIAAAHTVAGSRISGAALAGFFVQLCSSVTNGAMALLPTPIFVDPVTGMHVCLLRWCEWAPLAFLMAYLTAGMDADRRRGGMTAALNFGLSQGLSTFCGLLFPLLKPGAAWWSVMALAVLLHLNLHPLLIAKTADAAAILKLDNAKNDAVTGKITRAETEKKERVRVAAQLIQLLAVAWTLLVVFYFVAWYFRVDPTTHAIMECSVEVLSKHLYLNFLLDAHHLVFYGREEWGVGPLEDSSCESSDDEDDSDSDDEEDEDEKKWEEDESRRKMD